MSSILFVHRFLLLRNVQPSIGKAAVRCLASAKNRPKRKRRPRQRSHLFVPVVTYESEENRSPVSETPKLSDEDLDEMYEKKFYNSHSWKAVIQRQNDKLKKSHVVRPPQLDQNELDARKSNGLEIKLDKRPQGGLSYAAQALLEDAGLWRGQLSTTLTLEEPDAGYVPGLRDWLAAEGNADVKYPFAMVKPANEISKTLTEALEEETLVKSSYAQSEEDLPAVSDQVTVLERWDSSPQEVSVQESDDWNESIATVPPEDDLSLLNPKYVEKILLKTPYQQEITGSEILDIDKFRMQAMYGTPNPDIPSTNVPCGGCGAILHCHDSAVPGYLPSEMLENLTVLELQDTICQRCNFLKYYDVALNVSVSPQDYVRVISEIRDKNALVLLLVDLLDFPCSIWPGIIDIVGPSRSIVVVGNKVDLLPKDDIAYLDRIKMCLQKALQDFGVDTGDNIKHVALVSAKTGYGIEELITAIHHNWGIKGDVYAVGCTNVGKSSLFNALLQSDLCKSQAHDIIQRATVSEWPGTTLKLLKFPLLNPSPWRTYLRVKRLKAAANEYAQEKALRKQELLSTKNPVYATLIGNIGMTFKNVDPEKQAAGASKDPFRMSLSVKTDLSMIRRKKFRADDNDFVHGKWFYDTPGAVHHDQIINLLTLDELALTIPKTLLSPRCVVVRPGQSFFLAGLGRIDYIEGETSACFMLFASNKLPVSVVDTELADEFYRKYLGTEVLKVPFGGCERLKDFPVLKPKEMSFFSTNKMECCGDIVLSSAGWVSINLTHKFDITGTFLAYTPSGKGCYLRNPPLLKYSIGLRGKRISMTPFCQPSRMAE